MTLPASWQLFGDDHPIYHLLLLAKMIERETMGQLQREFDCSLPEWRVLAYVSSLGPASASEIGLAAEIDRAEISRAVAKLKAKDLVYRETDEKHRKRLIISPTKAGNALAQDMRETRRAYSRTVMAKLSVEERKQLKSMLEIVGEAVVEERLR